MKSRKVIWGLVFLGIGFILFRFLSVVLLSNLSKYTTIAEITELRKITVLLGTIQSFLNYGFNVLIGIFVFSYGSKTSKSLLERFGWLVVCSIFGMYALILFFVMEILEKLKVDQKDENDVLDDKM